MRRLRCEPGSEQCRANHFAKNETGAGGGRSRIRTYDPLIKSQLLYQLSYAPRRRGPPYTKPERICKAALARGAARCFE